MVALLVLLGVMWLIATGLLALHYYSDRLGFAPLLICLGVLVAFAQSQYGVYVDMGQNVVFFFSASVLIPTILMLVLVFYICNGTHSTRMTIISILAFSLLSVILLQTYRWVLTLPSAWTFSGLSPDELIRPLDFRTTLASLVAFTVDMFVIGVIYQGIRNSWEDAPQWFTASAALLAALWADSLIFYLIDDLGTPDFAEFLPGDILAKTIAALALAPLVSLYLMRFAPSVHDYHGLRPRPTFDLLFGPVDELRYSLQLTRQALRHTQQQRQQEAAYFQQIAEHTTEALWLAEPNRLHSFYINAAYGHIWGRSLESLYADPNAFVDAIHPEDRERILAGLPRQSQGGYEAEYRIVRPDGSVRWVRDRAFPILNPQGQVYRIAGICEDITERKLAEKQALELSLEREKVKLLRDFISEASHDLRSPVTAMNLKIHQMLKLPDPAKYEGYLQDMQQYANRMSKMIEDLLTLARMENPTLLTIERLDLSDLIQEAVNLLSPIIQQKRLHFQTDLPPQAIIIEADRADISRALVNLLENALRYTLEQGQVALHVTEDNTVWQLSLSDTGIGIPSDELPHIFESFYRSSNARQLDQIGSGLGLVIVKKAIERYAGRIEVESNEGQGTTFRIWLPKAAT
jgi:PAS domain S-box-containing protein